LFDSAVILWRGQAQPNNQMTLEHKAYQASMRVRKVHTEIELIDYERVMKLYDPEIPAFDIIFNKVVELTEEISRIDKLIQEG
jgi:hypothetical protein